MWWKTLDTVALLELIKRLESAGVPWYNVRGEVIQFISSHQAVEFTKSVLEWLK